MSPAAIVLVGGRGTRLGERCAETPKPLLEVGGRPFLSWVLAYLAGAGVPEAVLASGYRAGAVEAYLAEDPVPGLRLRAVAEPEPLGTGGALLHAAAALEAADPVLCLNGDSLALADLPAALAELEATGADGLLVGVQVPDASRFGTLATDAAGRLTGFLEKRPGAGLINAGVYLLRAALLETLGPPRPFSLEREGFPALLEAGADLRVLPAEVPFLDMGTPESLARAPGFVAAHAARIAAGGAAGEAAA